MEDSKQSKASRAALPVRRWWQVALLVLCAQVLSNAPLLLLAVTINIAIWIVISGVRLGSLVTARADTRTSSDHPPHHFPKVTVHVPCYSEPPEIVKATLSALAKLDWPSYEVICLDNNTKDPALWRPVEEHCRRLGWRFRFHHVDELVGAKAGALELALRLSDPSAEIVAVVDADYCVRPDFIARAWAHMGGSWNRQSNIAFVQFPQAYRNGDHGLHCELAHYFDVFMPAAESAAAALLTGTMSVIRRDALEEVGGWSSKTITEDAELGARLLCAGRSGRYDAEIVGRGLMPSDLRSLRSQRRRWVRGNTDTLFALGFGGLARLGARASIAVLAQLTAWFNFLLVPVVALVYIALCGLDRPGYHGVAQLAGFSIIAQLSLTIVLLAATPSSGAPTSTLRRKLLAHFGLSWEGATAWLEVLAATRLGFVRTSKLALPGSYTDVLAPLLCALLASFAAFSLLVHGLPVAAAGSILAALVFVSVLELRRQLEHDNHDNSGAVPRRDQTVAP